jgi:hypothetical protein
VADEPLARRAADVRARTGLKLPDAFAADVASFDERVVKAYDRRRAAS